MRFLFGSGRNKAVSAVRNAQRNEPTENTEELNASWTKKGPGRWRPPSPFSETREKFLAAFKKNPVNRLSGRELTKLEQLARAARRAKKAFDIEDAAETLIAQRRVYAGE